MYKDLIERMEEAQYGHINGFYAEAVNIRERKNVVIADVKLVFQMDGRTERYNDCEYPKELFKEVI